MEVVIEEKLGRRVYSPFVSFKVFKLKPQHVVFIVCQHVNVFIAKPKLSSRISKSIFVVCPVSIEVFTGLTKVVSSLNYLIEKKLLILVVPFEQILCSSMKLKGPF